MHRSSITLGLVLMLGCGTNAKPKVQDQPNAVANPGTSDVQHTLQLVFSIALESVENDSRSTTVDQAVEYIQTRLAYFEKTNILVRSQGEKIVVELPAPPTDEIRQIKNIILKRALLEFKLVDESEVNGFVRNDFMKRQYGFSKNDPKADELAITADIDQWMHGESRRGYVDYYLKAQDRAEFLSHEDADAAGCAPNGDSKDPAGRLCTISGRQVLSRYLAGVGVREPSLLADEKHQFAYERVVSHHDANVEPYWRTYWLHREVTVSGKHVQTASVIWNEISSKPEVLIKFTDTGTSLFSELTATNTGRKLAIVLDGTVTAAPTIQARIPGGTVTISMGGTNAQQARLDAQDLATLLGAGAIPALRFDSEKHLTE